MSTFQELRSVDDVTNDSETVPHRSRNIAASNESTLLKAMNQTGLTPIARAIGHDPSYITRFRGNEQGMKIEDWMLMLKTIGLRLIASGSGMRIIEEEDYKTLLNLANKGLRALNNEARCE